MHLMQLIRKIIAELGPHIMHDALTWAHVSAVDLLVDEESGGHGTFVRQRSKKMSKARAELIRMLGRY